MPDAAQPPRWLLLFHQLPKEPAYLRVKVGRRLASVGAVALKNSVYVLPLRARTAEDFEWIRNEIVASGGEATVVEAHLVSGLSDDDVVARFRAAKDAEYEPLVADARAVQVGTRGRSRRPPSDDERIAALAALRRIEQRIGEIAATDYFDAPRRSVVVGLLEERRGELAGSTAPATKPEAPVVGRTWVTRAGVFVDRIASAWLIRTRIDPQATFHFVHTKDYVPAPGELRFDMFEAEYSHEGDACTFETLLARFGIHDHGLAALGEVVHDLDLRDAKFERPEAAGFAACITGICRSTPDDEERIVRGTVVLEALYAHFSARNGSPRAPSPARSETPADAPPKASGRGAKRTRATTPRISR